AAEVVAATSPFGPEGEPSLEPEDEDVVRYPGVLEEAIEGEARAAGRDGLAAARMPPRALDREAPPLRRRDVDGVLARVAIRVAEAREARRAVGGPRADDHVGIDRDRQRIDRRRVRERVERPEVVAAETVEDPVARAHFEAEIAHVVARSAPIHEDAVLDAAPLVESEIEGHGRAREAVGELVLHQAALEADAEAVGPRVVLGEVVPLEPDAELSAERRVAHVEEDVARVERLDGRVA